MTKNMNGITYLDENDLVFSKVRPDAIIPTKEKENAGYDIYANFENEFLIIPPHKTTLIPTGIASAMSDKYYLQVHERGSTGSKGIKYSAGVIDSSYRGEIFIALTNTNNIEVIVSKLTLEELATKYGISDKYGTYIRYVSNYGKVNAYIIDSTVNTPDTEGLTAIIYPYTKAIAQLIVHEVPVMNQYEMPYDELLKIPSKRGTGVLGSSGK